MSRQGNYTTFTSNGANLYSSSSTVYDDNLARMQAQLDNMSQRLDSLESELSVCLIQLRYFKIRSEMLEGLLKKTVD